MTTSPSRAAQPTLTRRALLGRAAGLLLIATALPLVAACSTSAGTATSSPQTGASSAESVSAALPATVRATPAPAASAVGKSSRALIVQQWDPPTNPFGKWLLPYFQAFPKESGIPLEIRQRQTDVAAPEEQSVWVASGDVPDVFFRTGRGTLLYAAFAAKNVLHPLSPFIQRDKFDLSDFWPNVIKLMTAQEKQWVMPQDFNQALLGYNVASFQSSGVAPPPTDWKNNAWTWTEFLQREDQVQHYLAGQSGGNTHYAYGRPNGNWQLWLWSNGADLLTADWQHVALDQSAALAALDFAGSLMRTNRVAPTPADKLPSGQSLATLAVASDVLYAAGINGIRGQNPTLDFDAGLFPRGAGDYAAYGGGGGYVMSATTKQPENAWTLLKYIGSPTYAENKVKAGALGPRISTAKQFFAQPGVPPEHAIVYLDAPAHAHWEPNLTNWDDVSKAIDQALAPFWNGQQSSKQAVAAGKPAIEALIRQGTAFQ